MNSLIYRYTFLKILHLFLITSPNFALVSRTYLIIIKEKMLSESIRTLNLSIEELKLIAKNRGTKGYKRMPENKLLSILNAPKPIKENEPVRDIRKENYVADKILRDIKTLFESDSKDYYKKPITIGNAFSSNYIEYESNRDKDKTLSIEY